MNKNCVIYILGFFFEYMVFDNSFIKFIFYNIEGLIYWVYVYW